VKKISGILAATLVVILGLPSIARAAEEATPAAREALAGMRGQCDLILMTLDTLEDPILFPADKVDRKVALAGFQSVAFIGLAQAVHTGSSAIGRGATAEIQGRLKALFDRLGSDFDDKPVTEQIRIIREGFASVREATLPTGSQSRAGTN
jgi:hypothetical protein